ncbi:MULTISPECIES: response regulator [Pseudoalteromonas]|uniref:response regulator n=1 Tax=Pseudoalteromonas TaxID=53246 RepID=UPI0002E410E3|nr:MULTISPECIES: response regulator [Pseudoalteromonas]MCF6142609.1 two-component system, OmpR family, catabolic regulation response regulator CreB [Pseudoalteromonas mariniglutinosa NCIMB 1770]
MQHVLIVEDDADIAHQVILFFKASGFKTTHIMDGASVVAWVKLNTPDTIIMDVMLPNQDGVECLKQIRQFSMVPIIMVTAKVAEADRLRGLELGADDYVCKPFSGAELVMRVKAILRRCSAHESPVHMEELIEVNTDNLTVRIKGQQLILTKVEFDLFSLLYHAPNRIFSRQHILEHLQPSNFDIADRVIDSHIKNIRKKIKHLNFSPKIVGSVYGAGYRFDKQQIG